MKDILASAVLGSVTLSAIERPRAAQGLAECVAVSFDEHFGSLIMDVWGAREARAGQVNGHELT